MNSGPTLQLGSMGPDVRRLQILFVMTKLLDYTGIDGNFGPQTQDAVKSFQQMGTLAQGPNPPCARIKQTGALQPMELLAIRRVDSAGAAGRTLASLAGLVTV